MGIWTDVDMADVEAMQTTRAQFEAEMAKDLEESPEVRRAYGWPPMDPEGPEDFGRTPGTEWALDLPF